MIVLLVIFLSLKMLDLTNKTIIIPVFVSNCSSDKL